MHRALRSIALALVLSLLAPRAEAAQEAPTLEQVAARIAAIDADASLDEARRADLAARWAGVRARLESAAANRRQAEEWRAESAAADAAGDEPEEATALPPPPPPDAARADLEEALVAARKARADARSELDAIDARQADRSSRKPALAERSAAAREELEALAGDAPPAEGDARLQEWAVAERAARKAELESELERIEVDLAGFDARGVALERRARAAARREVEARGREAELLSRIQALREADAARDGADARAALGDLAGKHAIVQEIARRNDELADRRRALLDRSRALQLELDNAKEVLAGIESRMAATRRREGLGGDSQRMGSILRKERGALPDLRQLEQQLARHVRELTELRLLEFDLREEQRALRLPFEALAGIVSTLPKAPPLDEESRADAAELLRLRGDLVAEVLDDLEDTLGLESELESTESTLLAKAREFKAFIDERVLWVRSTTPVWRFDPRELAGGIAYFASPRNWSRVPATLAQKALESPGPALLYPLLVTGLFLLRRALSRRDERRDPSLRSVRIGATFVALARDVAAAAVWPTVLGVPAAALAADAGEDAFVAAVGGGLLATLPALAILALLRRLSRQGGTGELYLGWGQSNMRLLRRVWIAAAPVYLIATFAQSVVELTDRQPWIDTLGRYTFLAAMATIAVTLRVLLRPGGLTTPPRYRDEDSWIASLRPAWALGSVGGATALIAMSAFGFHYTARQLRVPFEASLAVMLGALVAQAIAFRWLLLARRRIQLEQARARRAAEQESGEVELAELPDLRTLGIELRRTVRAVTATAVLLALLFVWREEIPALVALDKIRLYPFSAPDGDDYVLTAAKVLVVVLAVFATGIVARQLPGLLDFLLLDRTGMAAPERYAMRTLTRYVVVVIGAMIVLAQLGITWNQLQWLAAAVSVGLGFGLQEIFANFVSGLILLFERPIRVGDLVTIDKVEGRVTNIRIRATTILDFDRREMIVPNKAFVTGSVLNWTLTDPITRVVVPVGVAYDSDIPLVRRLLLRAAEATEVVLRVPEPNVVFRHFGESALEFELRVFLGDRDRWIEATSGLHERIMDEFRAHGVEVPFPQRDVRVRSMPPSVETFGGGAPGPERP